jgi:hypothetical protein
MQPALYGKHFPSGEREARATCLGEVWHSGIVGVGTPRLRFAPPNVRANPDRGGRCCKPGSR